MEDSSCGELALPAVVLDRVLELVGQMWMAVAGGEYSPAEAEEHLGVVSRQVAREVLSAGLSGTYGKHEGPRRLCPCGKEQKFEGYREREMMTVLGPVTYRRAYYRCGECRRGYYAGDAALGLEGNRFSLPAQEAVSLLCSEVPFDRARELLDRLLGLQVSVSHAQHVTATHGHQVQEEQEAECDLLFEGTWGYSAPEKPCRLYITLDGTKTRIDGDWHETRVGAVYDVVQDEEGLDEPRETTYVTRAYESPEALGRVLYQEAARRGVEQAGEVVVVADGASWIWNLVAEHFPEAVQILDVFHASERLHKVGRAVWGEDSVRGRRWAERNVERLKGGHLQAVFTSLRGVRAATAEGREEVRKALGYFRENRQRVDYPAYRRAGMHIGSGVVEAACKHVVGSRCKRAGMHWTQSGIQAVLTLRCLLLNGRWDTYWKPLKAAA